MSAPILAAFDPVALDPAPVRFGATVAAFTGAPLLVASVYANDGVVDRLAGGQLGEDLAAGPGEPLDRIVAELHHEGVDAEALRLGATSAPRALSLSAEQLGAGMLAVGSAARAQPRRLAAGSTVARLLDGSPCAVAVVPLEWVPRPALTVIGAAFVDTAEGRDALHGAHALARRTGAVLRVLSAVRPRAWMLRPAGAGHDAPAGTAYSEVASEIRTRAEDAAHAASAGLLGTPVDIDVEILEAAELLLGASHEVDVLVCGSRGYGPRPATLLGGVTRRVTDEAACPVIVLAHGAEVRLEALIAEDGDGGAHGPALTPPPR